MDGEDGFLCFKKRKLPKHPQTDSGSLPHLCQKGDERPGPVRHGSDRIPNTMPCEMVDPVDPHTRHMICGPARDLWWTC